MQVNNEKYRLKRVISLFLVMINLSFEPCGVGWFADL